MSYAVPALIIGSLTFFQMLLFLYFGHLLRNRFFYTDARRDDSGFDGLNGALLALLGLLIAFTFSGAYDRYDARKKIISQEANAIGTAYLRLELLPEPVRSEMKAKFIEYIEARIELFSKLSNQENARQINLKATQIQAEIWKRAIETELSSEKGYVYILLLPALNEMFDITTIRKNAIQTHTPVIIFGVLVGLALICMFLAGMKTRDLTTLHWLYAVLFSFTMSIIIYLILDMEYPRIGIISLQEANNFLIDLRNSMR